MVRRRFSCTLLAVILLVAFGPLAEGWLHLAAGSHPEAHLFEVATVETTDSHRDCDAWQAESSRHDAHQNLQFEPAQALHHGDHAALCPACSHLTSAAFVDIGTELEDPSRATASSRPSASIHALAVGHIRSRAPPQV